MIERRSAKRFKRSLPLTFSNSSEEYRGVSLDFSASGLFILTREPFSPGTRVKINLEVSKKEIIRLSGVVVRTIKTGDLNVKDGMGIHLDETPYIYYKYLERFEKE
jgi:Tfp pilus assembly protein PilZ